MTNAAVHMPRQMENLTRGIVAVKQSDSTVYIGWRLFGTDPATVAFNLYRVTGRGTSVKVNPSPIVGATNFVDRHADTNQVLQYFVRPLLQGRELPASRPVQAWDRPYLEIPIQPISEYRPGDASIADLDGDGDRLHGRILDGPESNSTNLSMFVIPFLCRELCR
jgi:rhamnogalacturonan endolyase